MSPGTPSASKGMSVAPQVPLFPASDAATPSISPLPKFSGFFEVRWASLYDRKADGAPPMPGMAPSTTPITLPRKMLLKAAAELGERRVAAGQRLYVAALLEPLGVSN